MALRNLLLAALAVTFMSGALIESAHAKSKAACTKLVKAKPELMTPGGRCGEECRAAIDKCVKGQKI